MNVTFKTKTKWLLTAATAVCLSALIAIPLYAESVSQNRTDREERRQRIYARNSPPECPPAHERTGDPILIAEPSDCAFVWECSSGIAILLECPPGLWFCAEKNYCSWRYDTACSFDCTDRD